MIADKNALRPFLAHWSRSFTKEELELIAELYSRYENIKKTNKQIDYDDMLGFSYKIIKQVKSFRELVQDKFSHILVDEYQDTGRYVHILLQAIAVPA